MGWEAIGELVLVIIGAIQKANENDENKRWRRQVVERLDELIALNGKILDELHKLRDFISDELHKSFREFAETSLKSNFEAIKLLVVEPELNYEVIEVEKGKLYNNIEAVERYDWPYAFGTVYTAVLAAQVIYKVEDTHRPKLRSDEEERGLLAKRITKFEKWAGDLARELQGRLESEAKSLSIVQARSGRHQIGAIKGTRPVLRARDPDNHEEFRDEQCEAPVVATVSIGIEPEMAISIDAIEVQDQACRNLAPFRLADFANGVTAEVMHLTNTYKIDKAARLATADALTLLETFIDQMARRLAEIE